MFQFYLSIWVTKSLFWMDMKVDFNLWAKTDTDDFDVPAFFTYDLGNNLLGEVLQKEQEMNGDEISSDENPPPLTKQKTSSKPTARENLFDRKKIWIIDETFRELRLESPTKRKMQDHMNVFLTLLIVLWL